MNAANPAGLGPAGESVLPIDCGGTRLVGVLHRGASAARIGVVIVVGGGQYRAGAHRQFVRLARMLARHGISVLRFDVRGMGDSDGQARHFLTLGDDLRAAIDAMCERVAPLDGVVLWGLCDGASAAMLYAVGDPRIRGVVLVNTWVSTDEGIARTHLRHYYTARLRDARFWRELTRGRVDVSGALLGLVRMISRSAARSEGVDSGLPDAVFGALDLFRGETLIIISDADMTAREFEDELGRRQRDGGLSMERSRLIERVAADHTFSSPDAHEWLCETTRRWIAARWPAAPGAAGEHSVGGQSNSSRGGG